MPTFETNCVACNTKLPTPILSRTGILCKSCKSQGNFQKRLVITGITRMEKGRICVSGVDLDTLRFVRPVMSGGLHRNFAIEGNTQILQHFNVVEFEFRRYDPQSIYHTEDWVVNESVAPKVVRPLNSDEILRFLKKVSILDLNTAIKEKNRSLFVIRNVKISDIRHEQWEKFKVRISFTDGANTFFDSMPATDLLLLAWVRLQVKKGIDYRDQFIRRFNSNPYRFIRVGITREWRGKYWNQVTAVFTVPDMFDGESFTTIEKKLGEKISE